MKINDPKPISATSGPSKLDAARARSGEVGVNARVGAAGPGGVTAAGDRVEVGAASELFELVALVMAAPEPADEAAAIEAAVKSGSYAPNFRSLAERLVDHADLRNALGSE